MEHIHDHHDHTHDDGEVFAPAAENLLLDLAMQAHAGTLRTPNMPDVGEIATLEEKFDIKNIRARLGDAYPDMGFMGEAAVILAFADRASELPESHSRYDHSHGHDDGCGKTHGPVRRTLETLEHKVLGRIRNQRIKLVAAAAFRGSSLILCPGDDLAAIGLQMYGAFTSHTGHDEHMHTEHKAILPGRPRIDFAKGTAVISSLPLDVALPHINMPDTPAGRVWRERTSDPEPPKPETTVLAQPERKKRLFRRLAMVGAAAIAFVGGGFAVANAGHETPSPSVAEAPAVAPNQAPTDLTPPKTTQPDAPQILETARVKAGDSQWSLIENKVEATLGREGRVPLINALTHMSVHANDGTDIDPGEHIKLPSREVIIAINKAVLDPENADLRLVADVRILNSQNQFDMAASSAAIRRIQSYVF